MWRSAFSVVSRRPPCSVFVRGSNTGSYGGGRGRVWKPAAFTVLVGVTSYTASGIHLGELRWRWMNGQMSRTEKHNGLLTKVRTWWSLRNPADRFCLTVIAVNTGVFLLWRVPRLHVLMERYFLSSVINKSSLPILLSEFSHIEFWHIALNMLVLWSFAPSLLRCLGDRVSSSNTWPYYLTGGAFASMMGYYAKLLRGSPIGSLGASGALMAVVSLVVMNNPNSTVYILFFPFVPIPAGWALAGVVTLDTIGLVRGWQFFDHAGHLGGVLYAVLYQWWLHRFIDRWQTRVGRRWYRLKSHIGNRRDT